MNARVLGKELELLHVNGGRFEPTNQLLHAKDTAEQQKIGDKCKVESICRNNCLNGVVQSRGLGYEKC